MNFSEVSGIKYGHRVNVSPDVNKLERNLSVCLFRAWRRMARIIMQIDQQPQIGINISSDPMAPISQDIIYRLQNLTITIHTMVQYMHA